MIPVLWLLGIGLVGAVSVAIAVSGTSISSKQVEDAFCSAWAEGVRDPRELQYVAARVLMPEKTWPPTSASPQDEVAAWEQLGQIARRVAERGPSCQ